VTWGGAFPLLGEAWVGLGDGGSQARAAATGVTAWFVCLFFMFVFVCLFGVFLFSLFSLFVELLWGEVGWGGWVPSGGTVAPRIRSLRAPGLVDIRPSCPVAGPRKRGCLLQPVSGCPLRGSFSPSVYIPIPLSLLALYTAHTHTHRVSGACVFCVV